MSSTSVFPFRSARARERYLARYDERADSWPIASAARVVPTSYGDTFVRASGPVDAPPLVLLPGIGSASLTWLSNIETLSERFRTYAVDNIYDNGRSVASRLVTSADDFTSWLDELCTTLELGDHINFVGLSYGGWISAHYALRFPDRVAGLVLLAPAGTVAPIPFGFIWRAILCLIPARRLMWNFMHWASPALSTGDAETRRRLEEMVDDAHLAQRCFKPRKLVPPIPLTDEQLGSLMVPTLFITGEHEVIFPPAQALERLAEVAPQIETAVIDDCSHDLFVVKADEVSRRIVLFLERA